MARVLFLSFPRVETPGNSFAVEATLSSLAPCAEGVRLNKCVPSWKKFSFALQNKRVA